MKDIFNIMTANTVMEEAKKLTTPVPLYHNYWIEGEVCCLFADSNLGKSLLAVQIGEDISKRGETVLYYDFELSRKQFEMRYTDESDGKAYRFANGFHRVELNLDSLDEKEMAHLEEIIVKGIEANVKATKCKYIIVDNISWLVNMKSSPAIAGRLMMNLINLKKEYNLSVLVLAHTTKRDLGKPITQNDLQGSKRFLNFFDASFAIGQSMADPNLRYLKQIKVRSGAFEHDSNNVELCHIEKKGSFLGFNVCGSGKERDIIKKGTMKDDATKPKRKRQTIVREKSSSIQFINDLIDDSFIF